MCFSREIVFQKKSSFIRDSPSSKYTSKRYIYIAWHTKYFERVLEKLFWYLCLKFCKYSCQDISSILMSISRIAILQNIEGAYSLQLYERKNPFLCILPGFSKLFRNTWFMECCFEAASGQGLSGISWSLCKTRTGSSHSL